MNKPDTDSSVAPKKEPKTGGKKTQVKDDKEVTKKVEGAAGNTTKSEEKIKKIVERKGQNR